MKVLVTVTDAATVAPGFEIEGRTIPKTYLDYHLNEWDDYALAAASQVAASGDEDCEVVAVTVGPDRTAETARVALSKGADRAVRVWDDVLASAGFVGPMATARILAAVVEREAPDLVLSGAQASDEGFGATGVALAAECDLAWAAVVTDFDLDGDAVSVRRELESGVTEHTTVDLPAVLTIQTGGVEPQSVSESEREAFADAAVDVRSFADLDLDPGVVDDGLTLAEMAKPTPESEVTHFDGSPAETAADIDDVIRDAGVGAE